MYVFGSAHYRLNCPPRGFNDRNTPCYSEQRRGTMKITADATIGLPGGRYYRLCACLCACAAISFGALTSPTSAVTPESPQVQKLVSSALAFLEKNHDDRLGARCLRRPGVSQGQSSRSPARPRSARGLPRDRERPPLPTPTSTSTATAWPSSFFASSRPGKFARDRMVSGPHESAAKAARRLGLQRVCDRRHVADAVRRALLLGSASPRLHGRRGVRGKPGRLAHADPRPRWLLGLSGPGLDNGRSRPATGNQLLDAGRRTRQPVHLRRPDGHEGRNAAPRCNRKFLIERRGTASRRPAPSRPGKRTDCRRKDFSPAHQLIPCAGHDESRPCLDEQELQNRHRRQAILLPVRAGAIQEFPGSV